MADFPFTSPWRFDRLVRMTMAVLLVPGIVNLVQVVLLMRLQGRPIVFGSRVFGSTSGWVLAALASPIIVAISRRYPLGEGRRRVAMHLLLGTAFVLAIMAADVLLVHLVVGFGEPPSEILLTWGISRAPLMAMVYVSVAGITGTLVARARARKERERAAALALSAATLEAKLAQSQLDALRLQLHPHFLFNTLNTVSSLMRTGRTSDAVETVARLSTLLRLTLQRNPAQTAPLEDELAFIDRYLDVERIRFGDRLRVEVSADRAARAVPVPSLVLQPLVENALRHGLGPKVEPGSLWIRAAVGDGQLAITVEDDGVGLPPDLIYKTGIGLQNIRQRLSVLYGGTAELRLEPRPGGGTRILLTIPLLLPVAVLPDPDPVGPPSPATP